MRLKYSFETMELGDQIIAVPVGEYVDDYHGVIRLNETAAAIFQLIKDEVTEEAIVDALEKEYKVDRAILSKDVHKTIEEFQKKDLLI